MNHRFGGSDPGALRDAAVRGRGGCVPQRGHSPALLEKPLFSFWRSRPPSATFRARPRVRAGAGLGLQVAAPAATSPGSGPPPAPPLPAPPRPRPASPGGGARAPALAAAAAAGGRGGAGSERPRAPAPGLSARSRGCEAAGEQEGPRARAAAAVAAGALGECPPPPAPGASRGSEPRGPLHSGRRRAPRQVVMEGKSRLWPPRRVRAHPRYQRGAGRGGGSRARDLGRGRGKAGGAGSGRAAGQSEPPCPLPAPGQRQRRSPARCARRARLTPGGRAGWQRPRPPRRVVRAGTPGPTAGGGCGMGQVSADGEAGRARPAPTASGLGICSESPRSFILSFVYGKRISVLKTQNQPQSSSRERLHMRMYEL